MRLDHRAQRVRRERAQAVVLTGVGRLVGIAVLRAHGRDDRLDIDDDRDLVAPVRLERKRSDRGADFVGRGAAANEQQREPS